jgi:RNA polymerase sigma-70 factor, ECF subfamily
VREQDSSTKLIRNGYVGDLSESPAVAELDGPEVALAEVDGLPLAGLPRLPRHLRRPAPPAEPERGVAGCVRPTIRLAGNTAETAYLIRRRDQLASP